MNTEFHYLKTIPFVMNLNWIFVNSVYQYYNAEAINIDYAYEWIYMSRA